MNIKNHIKYWIDSANHDWDAAESLFSSSQYDWSLFLAHLVLEKLLKALYVQDNENALPPRTHNLVKLSEKTKIKLTSDQITFLDEVNDFNLEVRYPEFKHAFYLKCTKEFTANYFFQIKDMAIWLKSQIR